MKKIILHIDMDAFFASVEQKTFPFLRNKPIGVCGNPRGRSVIASASYEAKRLGVKSGMMQKESKRLCPEIIFVPINPAKYEDTACRIIAIFKEFTDLVEVFSIDEAFLDVTNTSHLFGGPERIGKLIKENIYKEFGLTCSVGIAPNKLLAKFASGKNKPDGLLRIKEEEIPKILEDLPVQELCGIGPKITERLVKLGIKTCGELGRTPTNILVANFGIIGNKLKNMGLGIDDSFVSAYWYDPFAKSIGHSLTLDYDTDDLNLIKKYLLALSEQVGRRLRRDNYQGRTITIVLRYADFTTFSKQKSLRVHLDDGYRIYQVGYKLFIRLYRPSQKIRLLGIRVSNLVKGIDQLPFNYCSLTPALDILNDRYGEWTIGRGTAMNLKTGPRVISPSWPRFAQPMRRI